MFHSWSDSKWLGVISSTSRTHSQNSVKNAASHFLKQAVPDQEQGWPALLVEIEVLVTEALSDCQHLRHGVCYNLVAPCRIELHKPSWIGRRVGVTLDGLLQPSAYGPRDERCWLGVGRGRAAALLLLGMVISADEALQMGLVTRVVAPEDLESSATALVREIARTPLAAALTWEALHRGANLTLEESAALGADYFGLVATTEEVRRRTGEFLERVTRLT